MANWVFQRQQIVWIDSQTMSSQINVTSSVGQWYPMSASLFNICLLDLLLLVYTPMIPNYFYQSMHKMLIWFCKMNYFRINCSRLIGKKIKVIVFHKCHSPLVYDHFLSSTIIERVDTIKDLGVIIWWETEYFGYPQ